MIARALALAVLAVAAGGCASAQPIADAPTTTLIPSADAKSGAHLGPDASARDPEISAEAYRSVLEAELKLQAGDVPGGIQLLREAVLHDPASPYLHVRLAEAYLEAGDAEQARASAQDALALDRKYVPAWRVVGAAWSAAGDRGQAKHAYLEALAASPGDRDSATQLAELLVEDGNLDEAERTIESVMQREPGAVDGYLGLARVFAERGEVERAFQHVARALEREPADTDALTLKLTLLWGLGRFDEALPVAKQLAAAAGDGPEVRRDLLSATALAAHTPAEVADADALAKAWLDDDSSENMRILVADAFERAGEGARAIAALAPGSSPRTAGETARLRLLAHDAAGAANAACPAAEAALRTAVTVEQKRVAAVVTSTCARAELRSHRAKDAGALVEKDLAALGAEPAFLEAAITVAKAGAADGKKVVARADAALAEKNTDVDIVAVAARTHEELGDVEKARQIIDDALRSRPKDPDLLFTLARHLERQKQPSAAVEIVERLLDRGRKGIDELNFVAFTLAEEGTRTPDAKKLAWRALVQDPLNGYVVDTLGWCELMAGDVDKSVVTLQRANRLNPGEVEILFHLAAALDRKGDKAAALETAARARTLVDDDDPVKPRVEALVDKLKKAGA